MESNISCPICTLPKKELQKLPCGHTICNGCKKHLLKKTCPFCRERFANPSRDNLQELIRPPTPMPPEQQVRVILNKEKIEDNFYRKFDHLQIKREKNKKKRLGTSVP